MSTIDLDKLLYGTPTFDEVKDFFRNGEFYEEYYLVEAIEKHLLTEEQRKLMFDHHLSIEKMLNGRYEAFGKVTSIVDDIYNEWNTKLGFKKFGF